MTVKKILILVENLPVPFDRRVWMEATTLTEAGYQVSVICPQGQYKKWHEKIDGIAIYRYPLPSLNGIVGHLLEYGLAIPITFLLSIFVWWREGIDAIQSANPPDFFFVIGLFFKLFGKKYVFDHHDLVPETCLTRWTGIKLKLIYGLAYWAEQATYRTADMLIATNQSYRDVAIKRGRVDPSRVFVVRSGPAKDKFQAVAPQLKLKKGAPFLVCYLGVMGPNDGLDYLLEAIYEVKNTLKRQDIHFTLIGSGDMLPAVKKMAHDLAIDDVVEFTGRIPDKEVIAYLSTADVCVAPDPLDPLNNVSTMNKIMEYMAIGKPIVAFDLKETRYSADSAAVYATPNNTHEFGKLIVKLLNDAQKRAEMGQRGQVRFNSELAWDFQKNNLVQAYQRLFLNFNL